MAAHEGSGSFREFFEGEARALLAGEGVSGLTVVRLPAGVVVAAATGNIDSGVEQQGSVTTLSHSEEVGFTVGAVLFGRRGLPRVHMWRHGERADGGEPGYLGYDAYFADMSPVAETFSPDVWVEEEGTLEDITQVGLSHRLGTLWTAGEAGDALSSAGRLEEVRRLMGDAVHGDWPFHYDPLVAQAIRAAA